MEAYGLHKYHTATGVVQWMGSNPWPGLIWHTYDYYLYPAGTYFGMKKALEPLHIMYSYASNEVDIVNSYLKNFNGLGVEAAIFNTDGSVQSLTAMKTDVEADSVHKCFTLPAVNGLSNTYFLRLKLTDSSGAVRSINWYWLSKKGDVLDWEKSKWYMTPETSYADYSALKTMGKTTIRASWKLDKRTDDSVYHSVTITNTGKTVAFQVHLRALKKVGGDDILPVIFSDNYIELAPGESRVIQCTYAAKDTDKHSRSPYFLISAWNLDTAASKAEKEAGFEEEWAGK
jgi:exo-1,4-beta-D-glucosaminidase